MDRLPVGLLYLTIYNPTLLPPQDTTNDNDEDSEELAHILFYTAKERAVSRDRMLRQVGLAKALVNFSEYVTQSSHMIPTQTIYFYPVCLVQVSLVKTFIHNQGE